MSGTKAERLLKIMEAAVERETARADGLAAIYLPLSVRNGGPDALVRYYRQTREFITDLQRDRSEAGERLRLVALAVRSIIRGASEEGASDALLGALEQAALMAEEGQKR